MAPLHNKCSIIFHVLIIPLILTWIKLHWVIRCEDFRLMVGAHKHRDGFIVMTFEVVEIVTIEEQHHVLVVDNQFFHVHACYMLNLGDQIPANVKRVALSSTMSRFSSSGTQLPRWSMHKCSWTRQSFSTRTRCFYLVVIATKTLVPWWQIHCLVRGHQPRGGKLDR